MALQQVDAYLDPTTGDLPTVSRLVTGAELIRQRIRLRLARGVGEWFLDPEGTGLPLIAWRQQRPPDVRLIVDRLQREVRAVPGVVRTEGWSGSHEPAIRRLTVTGTYVVDDGSVTSVLVASAPPDRNGMVFGIYFGGGSGRISGAAAGVR